jgi:hypothetical protein
MATDISLSETASILSKNYANKLKKQENKSDNLANKKEEETPPSSNETPIIAMTETPPVLKTTLNYLKNTTTPPQCSQRGTSKIDQVNLDNGQTVEICKNEFNTYENKKRNVEVKRNLNEYKVAVKEQAFREGIVKGLRPGASVCIGFTIIFMTEMNKFLKENKDAICNDTRLFYKNILERSLKYFLAREQSHIVEKLLNLIVDKLNVITMILSLVSFPLLSACATGIIGPIIDVITVAISVITEKLCTSERLTIKATVLDIIKNLRNTKLRDFYPAETLKQIGELYKNIKQKGKNAIDNIKNKTTRKFKNFKNKYQTLKRQYSNWAGYTTQRENAPAQRFSLNNFVKTPQENSVPQTFSMNNFTKARKRKQ